MPVFEYECKCGHLTTEITKEPKKTVKCEKCGGRAKKIISVPVVQMRFYSPAHPRFMRGQRKW